MKRNAAVLLAALWLLFAQEGRADVHIGDLEIFLSRLEIRVNRHERAVNDRIVIQKLRIAELEERIIKLETLLRKAQGFPADRTTPSSPDTYLGRSGRFLIKAYLRASILIFQLYSV